MLGGCEYRSQFFRLLQEIGDTIRFNISGLCKQLEPQNALISFLSYNANTRDKFSP